MESNVEARLAAAESRLTELEAFVDLVQRVPLFAREIGMHKQFCGAREAEKKSEAALAERREAGRPAREADFQRFVSERLVADGRPDRATTQGHILLAYREWADAQKLVASDRLTAQELATCVLALPGVRESKGMSHCRAVVPVVLGLCVRREYRQATDTHCGPAIVEAEHEEIRQREQAARPPRKQEEQLYV